MKPQPRYQRGDLIGNRYRVHQAILGGMSEVYLCLDLWNYPFALKTFQQRYITDPQRLHKAFEQEIATWVALEKHPNIVRCFMMETLDRQPFMVLEWIASERGRGADLRSWLRHGPLDMKLALQIAIDLCNGLLHAQAKRPGLVHCDLKPENILMAQSGLAKLTDFGLAQIAQTAGIVQEGERISDDGRQSMVSGKGITGTPLYMAPEQWRGEPLDQRTDIYAFGCVLYELLTGVCPFQPNIPATTPNRATVWLRALQHAHEQSIVAPLPAELPATLNELVQCCLAKAPRARYTHMADLLSRLTAIYQEHFDQPLPPRPTPDNFMAVDYINRGLIYNELGQREAALADYTQAIAINPNYAPAYYNRGLTYRVLGQDEAALADYNRTLAIDPTDAKAYHNRGATYANLGQDEAALADYNRTLAIDPQFAQAYEGIAALLANQGRLEEALPYFEKAAELGDMLGALYAADVRQKLGLDPALSLNNPTQQAFVAFELASSLAFLQQAVAQFPLMRQPDFIAAIEAVITQEMPLEQRLALTQRLTWLRQIANTQPRSTL